MASHKVRSALGDERFDLLDHAALDAAYISDNRTGLEKRQHLLSDAAHLSNGRAKDYQVRCLDRSIQIASRLIDRASSFALGSRCGPPHKTKDHVGQAALANRQTQGPTQQAHADQSDFLEVHEQIKKQFGKRKR